MPPHEYDLAVCHALDHILTTQQLLRAAQGVAASLVCGGTPNVRETLSQQREILKAGLAVASNHLRLALACVPSADPDVTDTFAQQLLALAKGSG